MFFLAVLATPLQAQVEPDRSGLGQAEFRLDELDINNDFRLPAELPDQAAPDAINDLNVMGLSANAGMVDVRSGRWATLMLSEPLLPGRGKGNNLSWANLGGKAPKNNAELARHAAQAFRGFVEAASDELRIDVAEMVNPGKVTVHGKGQGNTIQIYVPRVINGVPVRGSYLTATINNGNLTLFGANSWGDVNTSTVPSISPGDALETVQSHAGSYTINGAWRSSELQLIPVARVQNTESIKFGEGYDYRLAWVIRPAFDGDLRHFEALVDAHNGELLSFEDTNQYVASQREVAGGVLPVSNDNVAPDGVEQAGWPMPYDRVSTPSGTVTTDAGGNLPAPVDGNITSNLSGQYVRISDNCGPISLTSTGDIDFGTSGGTDCVTPGFGGAGNTHASRTGYHELNRIIEMGRGQLPSNSWLQQTLTSNMNINLTCNAFWGGGTVNFYRSGGGCANTGELAGVFDHEWGHGLDDNDALPSIASPSGEGIADVYTALRLNNSCIGRNFLSGNCSGNGDPCLDCSGVRDIDYLKRASGQPHDYSWSNANCGGSVHCVGGVYSEAVWSLWKRELQSPPYNYDDHTAHEIVTRLTYIGAGNTGTWFSGSPPNGGCAATSGYMNYLAADDDNGDLSDGTPHMTAIYNAFNDQEIACQTPAVQDSGCAGAPTTAPSLSGSAADTGVDLTWNAVAGASTYEVFRTDGVFGCDFGKIRVGETAGTSWNDTGLQNGRDYSYIVIPKGSSAACFGPASNCSTTVPAPGPNIGADPASAVLVTLGGDDDEFIDNCEDGTLTFNVSNTGLGSLTNVRITDVTLVSPAGTTILSTFPAAVSPSNLAQGASGSGSFDFHAAGLAFGDTLVFEVSVTSDEISPLVKTQTFTLTDAESDIQALASKTWDFETGREGWTVIEGVFNQTTTGGGAGGSSGYLASSGFLDNQCDQVRSPAIKLSASSTLSLENNYAIEDNSGQWWDRANIGIYDGDTRSAVSPDGGRLYNASGAGATCATVGQDGWASVNGTWGSSSWSATSLDAANLAGKTVQLDVAYGTDFSVNGKGFWFDKVTVTDIEMLVADGQSDNCEVIGCTIDAECDDGAFCNGAETCNTGTGVCEAGTAPLCEDDLFCNGTATCNEITDSCDPGTPPACDDGLFCNGTESCNEVADTCDTGTAPVCDDGTFCNGAETCNEGTDSCDVGTPVACDDSTFCNGTETCNEGTDSCDAGTPVICDDGLFCNGTDTCNEGTDSCDTGTAPVCNDGLFCNGTETCNEGTDACDGGTPVACDPGEICDEGGDLCVPSVCNNDGVCDAGETCGNCANDCISTTPGAVCGNGICEAGNGENGANCSADCNSKLGGKPANRFSCGPGGQYAVPCSDPRCTAGGFDCTDVPVVPGDYCCGDGMCGGPEDSSSCELDCGAPPVPVCGNGIIELGEMCDGSNLGGETCSDQGFVGGDLACQSDCLAFDTSSCSDDVCVPTASKEKGPRCSDGLDNDCDLLIDQADPDCQ